MLQNFHKHPSKSKSDNNGGLKYIENFDNPYVKLLVVCKICNKEQSLKYCNTWKRHYSFHFDDVRPHQCDVCDKSFKQSCDLKRHKKTHDKNEDISTSVGKPDIKNYHIKYELVENN